MTVCNRDGELKITTIRTFSVGDDRKYKSTDDDRLNYVYTVTPPNSIDLNFDLAGLSLQSRGFARFLKRLYSVSRAFLGPYAPNSRLNRNFIN